MAAATAAEIGIDPRDELALYVVHGLLHLCGYDDLSEPEASRMRRREGELLAACGRPNPFDLVGSARPSRGDCQEQPPSGLTHQSEPSPWSR
jgi:probable rRNA maturation factor